MFRPVKLQASNIIGLALLNFVCGAGVGECNLESQDFVDYAEFEDEAQGDPIDYEHDVLLLQVDMHLQTHRADAKAAQSLANMQAETDVSSHFEQDQSLHVHQVANLRMSLMMHSISQLSMAGKGWLALAVTAIVLAAVCVCRYAATIPAATAAAKEADEKVKPPEGDGKEARNRALGVCYFVVFMDAFGYGIFAPFVPLLREKFDLTATRVAVLLVAFSFSQGLATPVLGYMSDMFGRRSVILFALTGETCTYFILSFAESYVVLGVCYVLSGFFAATIGVASAFVADVTSEEERPVCMSYISGSIGLGIVLGPAAGGFLSVLGFSNAIRICAVLCSLNFMIAYSRFADSKHFVQEKKEQVSQEQKSKAAEDTSSSGAISDESPPAAASRKPQPTIPRLAWFLFFASFLGELAVANWESCGALYVNQTFFPYDAKDSTRFFAMMMMMNGSIVILVTLVIFPAMNPHTGQLGSFLVGATIAQFAKLVAPFVPHRGLFMLLCAISVLGDNLLGPSVSSLMTEIADPSSFGTCLGLAATFAAMARIIGPLMFAHMYDNVAHISPFLVVAGTGLAANILWVWVYFQKHASPPLTALEVSENEETFRRTSSTGVPAMASTDLQTSSFIDYSKDKLKRFRERANTATSLPETDAEKTELDAALPDKSNTTPSVKSMRASSM